MSASKLILRVRDLATSHIASQVESRISQFKTLRERENEDWFSELCFCILTANSSARVGMRIQESMGIEGFLRLPEEEVANRLKDLGHRFSERRAEFIVQAREFSHIKDIVIDISDEKKARAWLAENIMGLGYKEASHFLRNVGYDNLAILDRHILRTMHDYGMIHEVPKTLTRSKYLEVEAKLGTLATEIGMPLSKLDLYLWYMRTGAVLK